jgi:hypothetical protein
MHRPRASAPNTAVICNATLASVQRSTLAQRPLPSSGMRRPKQCLALGLWAALATSACTEGRFVAAHDAGGGANATTTESDPSETASASTARDAGPSTSLLVDGSALATDTAPSSEDTSSAAEETTNAATEATTSDATETLTDALSSGETSTHSSSDSALGEAGTELQTSDAELAEAGVSTTGSDASSGFILPAPNDAGADASAIPLDAGRCNADAGCADAAVEAGPFDSGLTHDAEAGPIVDPSDECPKHPDQTLRGSCGCGFEPDELCTIIEEGLTHRYSFDGEGETAFDTVGDADGEITGAELDGLGNLELDGAGAFVTLPTQVPLESTSVTLETWLTWHGGDDWQRIFDFGNLASGNWGGPGAPQTGDPETYVYLSPRGGADSGKQALLFAHSTNGSGSTVHLHGDDQLPIDEMAHVAVVISASAHRVALYLNGTRLGAGDFAPDLSDISDVTNTLGRSLFADDPSLNAALHEFRIYGRALTEEQVHKSFELGLNAKFSQPAK